MLRFWAETLFLVLMHPGREIRASYGKAMHTWDFLESGRALRGNQINLRLFAYFLTPEGGEENEAAISTTLLLSYWLPKRRLGRDSKRHCNPQMEVIHFSQVSMEHFQARPYDRP